VSPIFRDERLAQTTNIRVVERLEDADLPRERLEILIAAAVLVLVGVPSADLVAVYDLDGPPLTRLARHGLHDGGKGALPELMCHIVVRVYACQLEGREVPVDVAIVLEWVLLWHWRPKRDLVPVAQDARMALLHARAVDLHSHPERQPRVCLGQRGRNVPRYRSSSCRERRLGNGYPRVHPT
jgi:hypothetical protein